MTKVKKKLGRKPKFCKSWIDKCRQMALDGYTDAQMAEELGTTRLTLCRHAKLHPELAEVISAGKEIADNRVEDCLYKRACGYDYEEVQTEISTVNGQERRVVKKVRKHLPPDTGAAFIWLKNRRKGIWRDKHEIDIGTREGVRFIVKPPKLPDE